MAQTPRIYRQPRTIEECYALIERYNDSLLQRFKEHEENTDRYKQHETELLSERRKIMESRLMHIEQRINEVEKNLDQRMRSIETSQSEVNAWITRLNGAWRLLLLLGAVVTAIGALFGSIGGALFGGGGG